MTREIRFLLLIGSGTLLASSCLGMTFNYSVTTPWKPATCSVSSPPAAMSTFLPADPQVVVYFGVSNAAVSDVPKLEYYGPQGNLIRTDSFSPVISAGGYCFNSVLSIAGNPAASSLGMYTVKGYWNDSALFTLKFWILNPGLTADQKALDFQALASLYAKRYAPRDWKIALFQYDPLNLQPWLERIAGTKDDTDYLDVLVQYVAALNDTHSSYRTASDWSADLGLRVDGYFDDFGQSYSVLIDSINRSFLPSSTYPFQVGDELLSVDGVKPSDLVQQYRKYVSAASWESALHFASSLITLRYQNILPKAHLIGPTAAVEIKRQLTGAVEKYNLPWFTSGTALTRIGSTVTPLAMARRAEESAGDSPFFEPLQRFRNEKVEGFPETLGVGSLTPLWNRPEGFQQRLGRTGDYFYSGVIPARGLNVGYLRLPSFLPASTTAALKQLEGEISFFQDNTDGLVVDVMRNGGGDACYGEQVLGRLIPAAWRAMARIVRPGWDDIAEIQFELWMASILGYSAATKDLLQSWANDLLQTYQEGRLLSNPLSLCSTSGLDRTPATVVYQKPILLLVDELSMSAADGFAAQFQDNKRGRLFGWRTNGAGGTVVSETVGFYSESGTARVVRALQYRPESISTPDYPATNYVENVGVRPDVPLRYNTVSNFSRNGTPFVEAFLDAIAGDIRGR